jgi:hypothetical protein
MAREHVVSACLYPVSKAASRVQRITIPACASCNHSWEDDEAHFRNVILLAGDTNVPTQELWPKAVRGFKQPDGQRRLRDVRQLMEPVQVDGTERWMIYPGRDERVLRVVRKIVRGLSYFHRLGKVVTDDEVWADVMKFRIADEFVGSIEFQHREPDIFQYWFESYSEGEFHRKNRTQRAGGRPKTGEGKIAKRRRGRQRRRAKK